MLVDVYGFQKSGSELASRVDKYTVRKFRSLAYTKEGYAISDCKDEKQRQVLEFLIPILYPKKPTWVTVVVANTIFGAMKSRLVHWGKVIAGIVSKLTDYVKKSKLSPINLYLFHFYYQAKVMNSEEMIEYNTRVSLLKYGLMSEVEPGRLKSEDEEPEEEEQLIDYKERQRKSTNSTSRGKLPFQEKLKEKVSKFYQIGIEWVLQAQEYHDNLVELMIEIAKEYNVGSNKVLNKIKSQPGPEELKWKEEQIQNLEKEWNEL